MTDCAKTLPLAQPPLECLIRHMSEPTTEQIAQLTSILERFTRRFKVAEAAAAAGNALNALDAQALLFVSEHPGCGLGDVARDLGVVPTTMSSAIDRLVRKTMIERRRPDDNRRAVSLTATAKGHKAIEVQKAAYQKGYLAMLRSLDPAERNELLRLMEKISYSET